MPNTANPLVSIVTPVFNAIDYIGDTFESLQGVVCSRVEWVVVDDGSTDGSFDLISGLATQNTNIRVLRKENGGPAEAMNAGIEAARGELIARLDADDRWHSERISSQIPVLLSGAGIDLCGGSFNTISPDGRAIRTYALGELKDQQIRDRLRRGQGIFPSSSWMLRKEAWRAIGGFRSKFKKSEDFDFLIRLMERSRVHSVADIVCDVRKRSDSLSHNDQSMIRYYILAILESSKAVTPIGANEFSQEAVAECENLLNRYRIISLMRSSQELKFLINDLRTQSSTSDRLNVLLRLLANPGLIGAHCAHKAAMFLLHNRISRHGWLTNKIN